MDRAFTIALTCVLVATSAKAVREVVILDELQPARRVEGVVLDPSGAPISAMEVTDRSEGWRRVLRSTKTNNKGHFSFNPQPGRTVYYLRFDHAAFNPLELRLKIDKNVPQRMIIARPEIGG